MIWNTKKPLIMIAMISAVVSVTAGKPLTLDGLRIWAADAPLLEDPDTNDWMEETSDDMEFIAEGTESDDAILTDPDPGNPLWNDPADTNLFSEDPADTDLILEDPIKEEQIYLGIDRYHLYEGMDRTFEDGYLPTLRDGSFDLVIPFTDNGGFLQDTLEVELELEPEDRLIFQPEILQKTVEKQSFVFDTDTGQELLWVYLYRCRIEVKDAAASGQFPVIVRARGLTQEGQETKLEYRAFLTLPEEEKEAKPGETESETGDPLETETETEETEETIPPEETQEEAVGYASSGSFGGGDYGGAAEAKEAVVHQPKMLLEDCNLNGQNLEAGQSKTLEASFRNRSGSRSMYDLKITLTPEEKGVRLERNSFYFDQVAPGEEIYLTDPISVDAGAEAVTVPVTFSFEYEDSKGTAYSGTEKMEFMIVQPVRMELDSIDIPSVLYASDTVTVPARALNLGKGKVYNVRITLAGDGLFPREDIFLGNMEAGSAGDGEMQLYIGTKTMQSIGNEEGASDEEKYGPVSGTITLEYEDYEGKVYQETRDYQAEIKKGEILSLKVEEPEKNDWWISAITVVIAGLAGMVLLLAARIKRKNVLLQEVRR